MSRKDSGFVLESQLQEEGFSAVCTPMTCSSLQHLCTDRLNHPASQFTAICRQLAAACIGHESMPGATQAEGLQTG